MKKRYNRPTAKWVCGKKREGKECALGPSSKGICNVKYECNPLKKGDRFFCTRSSEHGGPCQNGPLPTGECDRKITPCTPVRSTRFKRKIAVIYAVSFSICFAFFILNSKNGFTEKIISPGPLSNFHRLEKHQCSACHANVSELKKDQSWVNIHKNTEANAKKCLNCHKIEKNHFTPHNLDRKQLMGLIDRYPNANPEKRNIKLMYCMDCHKEHKGEDVDISTLTNQQCQSCHVKTFDSFANGHPEFSNYPYDRKTRILFDHQKHIEKHFSNSKEKITCRTCHVPEYSGKSMVMKSFDKTCASCHETEIYGKFSKNKGIVFLQVPALDLKTLKRKGKKIGDWPNIDFGELSSFTKLLIESNDELAKEFSNLKGLDLDDLESATSEQLNSVEKLAWGLKELFFDLIDEDSGNFKARIEKLYGEQMSDKRASDLLGALPIDTLRSAFRKWFPTLSIEINQYRRNIIYQTRGTKKIEEVNEYDEDWMVLGGWYRSDEDYSIRYRPSGHEDSFIKSWLDLTGLKFKENSFAKETFNSLSGPRSPGKCTSCHSVEKNDELYLVNWTGKFRNPKESQFIKFSHSAHFVSKGENACTSCHIINKDANFLKAYGNDDIHQFESNFFNLKKEQCTECHKVNSVGDSCTLCHSYHIK